MGEVERLKSSSKRGEESTGTVYRAVEGLLAKFLSLSPGFDPIMLLLFILYKRPVIKYSYLQYLLGGIFNEPEFEKLKFLGVELDIDDEGEKIVKFKIGGIGWMLVDSFYYVLDLLDKVEWPKELKKRYMCLAKATPAVILAYATFSAAKDLVGEEVKNVEDGGNVVKVVVDVLPMLFEKAVNKDKLVFCFSEAVKDRLKDYSEEDRKYVAMLLEGLSNFLLINYVKETDMLIFDKELVEGIKLAAKECEPRLENLSLEGLKKWLKQLQQLLSKQHTLA